jgi:hypothetical protein
LRVELAVWIANVRLARAVSSLIIEEKRLFRREIVFPPNNQQDGRCHQNQQRQQKNFAGINSGENCKSHRKNLQKEGDLIGGIAFLPKPRQGNQNRGDETVDGKENGHTDAFLLKFYDQVSIYPGLPSL